MILVTGANGFIGSFICRQLLQQGHQVRALKRKNSNMALVQGLDGPINWLTLDLEDLAEVANALAGVQTVIHCAAVISMQKHDRDLMYRVNVEGTRNLVNQALHKGIQRFIHISSVAAIMNDKAEGLLTENTRWEESATQTTYGYTKHLAELEVARAAAEGIDTAIINPSLVIGPGLVNQGSTSIFGQVAHHHRNLVNGQVNYVDVREVVSAVMATLTGNHHNQRFILNAGTTTYEKLYAQIAEILNVRPPRVISNGFQLKLAYLFSGLWSMVTQKPAISKELLKRRRQPVAYDGTKAAQALSIQYRPLNDTLQWAVSQLQANGQLA